VNKIINSIIVPTQKLADKAKVNEAFADTCPKIQLKISF